MPLENYTMGYKLPVMRQRFDDYQAGLLDPWEIVLLYQDMIEAECLPASMLQYAIHMVEMGLCYIDQRATQ